MRRISKSVFLSFIKCPTLGWLRQQKFAKLQALGVTRVERIPPVFELNVIQTRIRDCVKSGKLFVAGQLRRTLDRLTWPVYYLDFETVGTALPLYSGIAPHQQIPTQYSVHKCDRMGRVPDHFEYLADPARDCRRELAARLVQDLGNKGSILTYTNFETRIMQELAVCCPELKKPLNTAITRCVDLKRIIQESIYHPDFHGSFSIKDVLPALLRDRSYGSLEIHDGSSAMSVFANLARGEYEPVRAQALKQSLLDYCEQDTLSMVWLHEKLAQYA
jgi:uncharacterized protein YbaR (Trm112 family)